MLENRSKIMSSNVLFCLPNSPKPMDVQFISARTIINHIICKFPPLHSCYSSMCITLTEWILRPSYASMHHYRKGLDEWSLFFCQLSHYTFKTKIYLDTSLCYISQQKEASTHCDLRSLNVGFLLSLCSNVFLKLQHLSQPLQPLSLVSLHFWMPTIITDHSCQSKQLGKRKPPLKAELAEVHTVIKWAKL